MSRPSKTGMRSAGQPLKKTEEEERTIDRARRIGLLSVADGGTHMGATRAGPRSACAANTRSPDRVISGITLDGRLFLQVHPGSYNAVGVVGFLRVLCARSRASSC
jgi:hypothetical protein